MRWQALTLPVLLSVCPEMPAQNPVEKPVSPQDRQHWSFQPVKKPVVPVVRNTTAVRNPVDAFILSKQEAAGIAPAKAAEKLSLLRRVTFDLTGLPPTLEEQDAFLADSSPTAYEKVVDRLLASPHFGERQAQHWLDVVRFSESNGYEADGDRVHAWRYRDYVVNSLNSDKPYDTFLIEQLAGDELATGKDPRQSLELLVATGFHRAGPVHLVGGNSDQEVARQEVLTEIVQGIGSALLGMTVSCARCHDHKFDPVSQADYYRLEAFFAGTKFRDVDTSNKEEKAVHQKAVVEISLKTAPLKAKVAAIDGPYRQKVREAKRLKLEPAIKTAMETPDKARTEEQKQLARDAETLLKVTWDEIYAALSPEDKVKREALRAEMHTLEAQMPAQPGIAWAMADDEKIPATHILKRGEVKRKGEVVQPAFPRVIDENPAKADAPRLKRLDLAKWIASPKNPLTARVIVNRLWLSHFGRGIVNTPNDYGLHGEPPTHPELLDWLASELVSNGWKLKPIHRLMVLSNTYQQASQQPASPAAQKADPDNKLLWKMNRRRLEGEAIRDASLASSGELNRQTGGPSVRIPLEPEVYDLIFTEGEPDGLWAVTPDEKQHARRSLYLFGKRNVRLPLMEAFDQPDRLTPCAARPRSTFAPQALILINGPFTREQSLKMATSLLKTNPADPVTLAYRRALGRTPTAAETKLATEFLREQTELMEERLTGRLPVSLPGDLPANASPAKAAALADFCLALLNSNEFVYVP
ncbi:DUF1549 and DUF1553 domain-containing protein [Zavarzinella formosa]|uniref:DUF1549 and DUF1553 domain-containing protein n=1 Tax=Zavarzinella formosa TaxID=360055 RepID=UPI0002FEDC7A|nr:DUF1549 and DUF1553 domain-containing protein [Zavarzinella formosa]